MMRIMAIRDGSSAPTRHVVKRYAGTRRYDTSTLSYVTVDRLRALLRTDAEIVVYDAETGADITNAVLDRAMP
jgi:polyhydroxyalkanoate synthesis regulator protein